jgi:WD40 repeat protein
MFFETAWTSVRPRTELATLEGHTDLAWDVCSIEVGDLTLVASASRDATVRIWDPAAGQPVHVLRGHTGDVEAVHSVGRSLVSAGQDSTVRVWDPVSGGQTHVLDGYRGASPVEIDGRVLVASGTANGAALWDPETGHEHKTFVGASAPMTALRVGERVLVAARGSETGVGVWDANTGDRCWLRQPDAHTTMKVCAVPVGDRMLVASAGYDKELDDGRVRLWDPLSGEPVRTLEFPRLVERALDRVRDLFWLDVDGRAALVVVAQKTLRIVDPATGEVLRAFVASTWIEAWCRLSVEGGTLFAVSESYRDLIRIWDPVTGRQINELRGEKNPIEALHGFEINGQPRLASADATGLTVRIWDPFRSNPVARGRGHRDDVYGVWPVADRMISVAQSSARFWNPADGSQPLKKMRASLFGIVDVVEFMVDGRLLLAGAFQVYECGRIRIWDPATGRQVRRLERRWEEGPSVLCPFTVGERVLLAAGTEDHVRVWDPSTGRLESQTPCGSATRWLGRIVVDGRPTLAGRDEEHGVRIWDPAGAAWQPAGADSGEYAFMLGDRALVAEAEKGGEVRVADLVTGETRCVLRGHTGYWITGIGVATLDSRLLLLTSGGADRTVRLWAPDTGSCVLTIPVHHEAVRCAQVGEDLLAVAAPSGVLVYRVRVRVGTA